MHKVVVDTNVFISGILFGGTPRKVIEAWINKKYILCLSPELKSEILGKLQRKFLFSKESLGLLEEILDTFSQKYIPKTKVNLCKDPQDNFLLELSEMANVDFLISGDKQVLRLMRYKKTRIISPAEFLELFRSF